MAVDEQEVAEGDDGVVGAVVAQQEEEDAAVVLLTIAVRADRRRQGVGRALVRALAARAEAAGNGDRPARVVADVARDNAPARALLEASGFDFGGGGGKKKDKSIEGVLEL
jgi:ribosomal protein S18 acetylase RimI-like enzyme